MVLLECLYSINHGELRSRLKVITFDHGIRAESFADAQFVMKHCRKLNIPCEVHSLFLKASSNVEHSARELRYQIYARYIRQGGRVLLAHHIDDAFEWYLLQSFKTSTPCYGIPVKNSGVARPFLCVTRDLIKQYAHKKKITYREDQTNNNLKYERNYIRHKVIPTIRKQYPHYLKSFVFRMNRSIEQAKSKKKANDIELFSERLGGVILQFRQDAQNQPVLKDYIVQAIHQVSRSKRGSLMVEVDKLLQAISNGKKGPMSFSGNVGCMISRYSLYFYPKYQRRKTCLSEPQKVNEVSELYHYPFIKLDGALLDLPQIRQKPEWLDICTDDLIFTPELFSRVFVQQTISRKELIDCNFQFVRLI